MQAPTLNEQETATTAEVIARFSDAFGAQDVDAIMALMADDCVYEHARPWPDGTRYEGSDAVRGWMEEWFRAYPNSEWEIEEQISMGDRCVSRWVCRWIGESGKPGRVRGVDVFRVRDGKVAEKLAYVKG